MGFWRTLYYYAGWEYKPTETTEKIKRNRHEVMVQIRSYGDNIKDIVLKEEGEIPKVKATRTPTTARAVVEADYVRPSTPTIDLGKLYNHNDFLDGTDFCKSRLSETLSLTPTECDAPASIPDYTALLEGIDLPRKKKKRKKRNSNKLNF